MIQFPKKKGRCAAGLLNSYVRGEEMAEIGKPPFGYNFDPDELARLYHQGVPAKALARIGIPD
jgi:hypothetical protein